MFSGADFSMSSVQTYTESLREALKQAVLDHDAIFRSQVRELHRLYNVQKSLMEDLRLKGSNSHNSLENAKSNNIPAEDPRKCNPRKEERAFSELSVVDLTQSEDEDLVEERRGMYCMRQQGTLDLELPASDYINHVGKGLPEKGISCAPLIDSLELKSFRFDDHISNPEEATLSLSTGMCGSNKGSTSGTSCNKQVSMATQNVIHLEDSIERLSKEAGKHPFSIDFDSQVTYVGYQWGSQNPVSSDSSFSGQRSNYPNHIVRRSLDDYNGIIEERKSFTPETGLSECHGSSPSVTLLTENRPSVSPKKRDFDLNKVQTDESTHFSSSSEVAFPSPTASSSGGLQACKETFPIGSWWRQPNNSCSNETPQWLKQDNDAHLTSLDSGEKSSGMQAFSESRKFVANNGGNAGIINISSLPVDQLRSCETFSSGIKNSEESIDQSLGQQCATTRNAGKMGNFTVPLNSKLVDDRLCSSIGGRELPQTAVDVESEQVICEKSEEAVSSNPYQSQNPFEDPHSVLKDPVMPAAVSASIDEKSSDQFMLKVNQDQLEEVKKMDVVCSAAESLIQISLEKSVCSRDSFSNAEREELAGEQSESDSYEAIVLRLKENSLDDYCLTSTPMEVETENTGTRPTLRRGRRLKDFQKDILPGLVTLSRHEICEDMHSFNEIMNPKESRKNRSKKASGESWGAPMRSRRSSLRNAARRRFF